MANLADTYQSILRNGGGTFYYDSTFREFMPSTETDGYYVAIAQHECIIPLAEFNTLSLRFFRNDLIANLYSVEYVGAWINDGQVYLDSVMHIKSRSLAIELGRSNSQLAIWDIAASSEIVV